MLQHVIEVQIFDLIFCRMDLVIGVLEVGFNDESRRIAGLRGRSMIRASVATLRQHVGYLAILKCH